ncbi:extracellular solute-binding protein [Neobacillus sp. 114]|uniref:extracellular solute-binding protein n=1 Tax=Neobacillus sp. 114 TaxID=3048535 RepID=UPI0024C2E40C|nr:extracellular solute-binding protein [Neobacillus sp. 114]
MRKWLSMILVSSLVTLAGCGVPNPKAPAESKSSSATPSSEVKEINIAGGTGVIENFIREEIIPKYQQKTGIKVNYTSGQSNETISKVEIQKNAPELDLVFVTPTEAQNAVNKGLIEQVDEKQIPNLSKLDDQYVLLGKNGTPFMGFVVTPVYNKKSFEENHWKPIESWNDLIRAEYKGKTGFADVTNDYGFTILYNLARANGGSEDNLEPGLNKAKDLAGYSDTFYKGSTQIMAALQQGAADLAVLPSYSIYELVSSGLPLKMAIPKEGAPLQGFHALLVKNSKHQNAAQEFINLCISEDIQKVLADSSFYPVIKGTKVSDKVEQIIGLKESDKIYKPDVEILAKARPEMVDRFSKEVSPLLGKKVNK